MGWNSPFPQNTVDLVAPCFFFYRKIFSQLRSLGPTRQQLFLLSTVTFPEPFIISCLYRAGKMQSIQCCVITEPSPLCSNYQLRSITQKEMSINVSNQCSGHGITLLSCILTYLVSFPCFPPPCAKVFLFLFHHFLALFYFI